jgi:hypothetical protein
MSTSVPHSPSESFPPPVAAAAPTDTSVTDDARGLDSLERAVFWIALGGAVTSIVLGAMMVAWPEATLKVIAALFGIWLLLHGVVRIVQAITASGREGAERAILGVIGILFVVAGVIALRNLLGSLAVVVTLIGLMWLIGGIAELISAFTRRGAGDRGSRVVLGVLSIAGALVVLVWPDLSLVTVVWLTGAWMITMGAVQVALVLWVRRNAKMSTAPAAVLPANS